MKIYISEYLNCIGYCLLGDKNQLYTKTSFFKKKDINNTLEAIEKALFYVLVNKPLYAKDNPEIYSDNLITLTEINNSTLVKKFKKDKGVTFLTKDKNLYTKEDTYYLMIAKNQARFLNMFAETKNKGR